MRYDRKEAWRGRGARKSGDWGVIRLHGTHVALCSQIKVRDKSSAVNTRRYFPS